MTEWIGSETLRSLEAILARRPLVICLAGPNGAGKSSFFDAQLADMGLTFVNADILALTASIDAYEAADIADKLRRQLLGGRESFIFETVFSDPVGDKIEFLKSAESAEYAVLLIFIGVEDASKSDQRVSMRVSQGGHDVPAEKLRERYPRVMRNLKRALVEISNVLVYDNSNLDAKYRMVASKLDGVLEGSGVETHGATPEWLAGLLP